MKKAKKTGLANYIDIAKPDFYQGYIKVMCNPKRRQYKY
ncbi:hypothetical protein SAMN05421761_10486 [Belliella pelovolcani]|uniref:Uncharacterized protein n=1 Tax=Belliella pelovolcani TaxID=529505 RepID=A0A1N7LSL9_9BACT|nr:hypothetical protein SAMN05421761_10486 [Belliella pelovolcani]